MIYLASQSPRRSEILKNLRIPFRVVRSAYTEKNSRKINPEILVLEHAWGKVSHAHVPKKARFVLGSDTIVYCQDQILGKPRSLSEAKRMLKMLSGREHRVFTGIVLGDLKTDSYGCGVAETQVYMDVLSEGRIQEYFSEVSPWDKAGSYAIQEGPRIVKRIRGSYTNVVGFPVELLKLLLEDAGINPVYPRSQVKFNHKKYP